MNSRGISLLEILVASGIMVAAMVPLWNLMGSSHKQVTLSADEIKASQLTVEILEQIENSGWWPENGEIGFTPVSEGKITLGNTSKLEVSIGNFPEYLDLKGTMKIARHPPAGEEAGKIVRLIMNYKTREKVGNLEKTYELSTFISRK
jgi:hypothetical protein